MESLLCNVNQWSQRRHLFMWKCHRFLLEVWYSALKPEWREWQIHRNIYPSLSTFFTLTNLFWRYRIWLKKVQVLDRTARRFRNFTSKQPNSLPKQNSEAVSHSGADPLESTFPDQICCNRACKFPLVVVRNSALSQSWGYSLNIFFSSQYPII